LSTSTIFFVALMVEDKLDQPSDKDRFGLEERSKLKQVALGLRTAAAQIAIGALEGIFSAVSAVPSPTSDLAFGEEGAKSRSGQSGPSKHDNLTKHKGHEPFRVRDLCAYGS
jgi:hypothetical protein